jgi:hypothetical protein
MLPPFSMRVLRRKPFGLGTECSVAERVRTFGGNQSKNIWISLKTGKSSKFFLIFFFFEGLGVAVCFPSHVLDGVWAGFLF